MNINEHKAIIKEMFSKTNDELEVIFNTGVFNEITKGYCLLALKKVGANKKLKQNVIDAFYSVFDLSSSSDALEALNKFYES